MAPTYLSHSILGFIRFQAGVQYYSQIYSFFLERFSRFLFSPPNKGNGHLTYQSYLLGGPPNKRKESQHVPLPWVEQLIVPR